ncbi:hypothetical protein WI69_14235 [Burkholderia diffusa]|nr:hypothetical protein WI69_14235 [Burkholderia diffusa]
MRATLIDIVGACAIRRTASRMRRARPHRQRTGEQAASLQETAATIKEFTSTVRLNAEYAQQASMLAARMSAIAHVPDCAISGPARSIRETGSRKRQALNDVRIRRSRSCTFKSSE